MPLSTYFSASIFQYTPRFCAALTFLSTSAW